MSADDLISALFDGELNDEERAAAVKRLQAESATRREREEIAQLSAALKGLPKQTAPDELRSRIRQRLERESLLGKPSEKVVATVPAKPRSTRTMFIAAGLLTTVAGLFLMVYLVGSGDGTFNEVASNVEVDSNENEFALRHAGEEQAVILADLDKKEMAAEARDMARYSVTNSISEGNPARLKKALPSSTADGQFFERAATTEENSEKTFGLVPLDDWPDSETIVGLSQPGEFSKDITKVPLGTVVAAQQQQGDQVSVVYVTVVDRFESLNDFQVLLQRHEINSEVVQEDAVDESSLDPNSETLEEEKITSNQNGLQTDFSTATLGLSKDSEAREQDLFAVFVTAPPEKMQAALEEMQQVQSLANADTATGVSLSCTQFAQNMDTINVSNNGFPVDFETYDYADNDADFGATSTQTVISMKPRSYGGNGVLVRSKSSNSNVIAESDQVAEAPSKPLPELAVTQNRRRKTRLEESGPTSQEPQNQPSEENGLKMAIPDKSKPAVATDFAVATPPDLGYQVALTFPRSQLGNLWSGVSNYQDGQALGFGDNQFFYHRGNLYQQQQGQTSKLFVKQMNEPLNRQSESADGLTDRIEETPIARGAQGSPESAPAETEKEAEAQPAADKPTELGSTLAAKESLPAQKPSELRRDKASESSAAGDLEQKYQKKSDRLARRQVAQYLFIFETPRPKRKPVPAERPGKEDSSFFILPPREEEIPS
ncbi:MAG: hypothetical protein KDA65_11830 [Planctomycetaceae bacterium]|nr:hypothetical protein [Planctomycetaceae bacterium]